MVFFAFIWTLLSIYALLSNAQHSVRTPEAGWPTQNWYASRSMNFSQFNAVESFAYQASTGNIIVGNFQGANINSSAMSFPFSNSPNTILETAPPMREVAPPISLQSFDIDYNGNIGSFGLQTDPYDDTLLWQAIGNYPPTLAGNPCTIGVANMTNVSQANIFDFPNNPSTNPDRVCFIDDLVISSTTRCVYGTDYFGYRILQLCPKNSPASASVYIKNNWEASVLSDQVNILCSDTNTSNCGIGNCGPMQEVCNGPNGIVIWTDSSGIEWLLINVIATLLNGQVIPGGGARLIKMSTTTQNSGVIINPGPNTPSGALQGVDGMTIMYSMSAGLPSSSSVLYAVGETLPTGTVQVISSVDGWTTYEVRNVMNALCPNGVYYDTAARVAGTHLLVNCNNNFQGGNQQIHSFFGFNGVSSSPIAVTVTNTIGINFMPESFGYDPNRNMLVMGSVTSGVLRGYTFNNVQAGPPVNIYPADSYVYWDPSKSSNAQFQKLSNIFGVNVNPNGVFGNTPQANCFAIVANGFTGFGPGLIGISVINLCLSNTVDALVQFVPLVGACSANDIAVLGAFVYVTDTCGNQVFAVEVANPQFYLNPTSNVMPLSASPVTVVIAAGNFSASPCKDLLPNQNPDSLCMGYTFLAPDGIVAVPASGNQPGYIIVSMVNPDGNVLTQQGNWKFIPSQSCTSTNCGQISFVTEATGIFSNIDGMKFNQDRSLLFGTRNSFVPTGVFQSVAVAYSCDNWMTANLAYTFQTQCPNSDPTVSGSNPPAIALVPGLDGTESLVAVCNDGFGSATSYPILVVNDVNAVVSNNANNGVANFCPTTDATNDDNIDATNDDKASSSKKQQRTGIYVLIGIFVFFVICILYHKFIGSASGQVLSSGPKAGSLAGQSGHEMTSIANSA